MSFRRKIRQVAESALVCLGLALLPLLTRNAIVNLGRMLGNAGFRLARRERAVAEANLAAALGRELAPEGREQVARESFRAFALVILDVFWFSMFTRARLRRWVEFDPSSNAYFKRQPAIAATGHLGNWEILGLAAGLAGNEPLTVAMPLLNPFVDGILNRLRQRTGQRIVQRQGALRKLIGALRKGGSVALLMDQNTLPRDGGEFVDFFGLPVPVSRAAAGLSERTGAPVVPVYCTADEQGRYCVHALLPIGGSPGGKPDVGITQAVAGAMETEIRKSPGQWLWMYKRWKYVPAGRPRDGYPFYAKEITV